jgi:phage anti-repressor protein
VNTVNARDLWKGLGIKKDFSNWIKAQIERAFLVEGRDFIKVPQKGELSKTGQIKQEYFLTIESAKHIAMMSGPEKGYEHREYFIYSN